jgi:uncharacterized membrane protein
VGVLLGALARVDGVAAFSQGIALGVPAPAASVRLGLFALLAIFIYAFFKFTWTLRQYNYCIAMIGAAPMPPIEEERHARLADALARSISVASINFNVGLRCYYFAFAALAWFLHPLLVPLTTSMTMVIASNVAAVLDQLSKAEPREPGSLRQLM